jgi:hypothetical protein
MIFDLNDRWVLQDSCVGGVSPSNHFSRHEKSTFQTGSLFSWWWLRANQLEGVRQLLDVLQTQERCYFRDLITGDETWVSFDMKPRTIWFPADVESLVRVKRTIASEKCMLVVFWRIHGIAHYCWLPKESTLDLPFFCEEVLSPLAQNMQPNSKKLANPWLWFIWTLQGFTEQGQPKRNWMFPDSNARRSHRIARVLHHPTFSIGWKPSLNGENIVGKMNYTKSRMKFWQASQLKWSKRSLLTGWIDSKARMMEMVKTFPKISQVKFWTELNNGKHVRTEH